MPSTVTLAQIATYTGVQRPSVSNWRRRHSDFPDPCGGTATQPLFDADAVGQGLDRRPTPAGTTIGDPATTYGELFRSALHRGGPTGGADLDGDTLADIGLELVALRAAYGEPL